MKYTSIKQVIQDLIFQSTGIKTGTIVSTDPLGVRLADDEKITLSGLSLCLPVWLTNFEVDAECPDGGAIKLKIKNSLNVGDTVYMIAYNDEKKYYILDRVAG